MHQDHRRSPLSVGIDWASRITTLGLEFSLPPVAGHVADRQLGTGPALLLLGMVLGFGVGMIHLVKIARVPPPGR
ncbi:hypothetical protein TA3x_003602 [Tundrisphaera sp. TA3]|uniref:hypothetical protein n=1 Tax=Tundrisphaera sp. TA3 TaxID=3435775 RepID=UPI003EB8F946